MRSQRIAAPVLRGIGPRHRPQRPAEQPDRPAEPLQRGIGGQLGPHSGNPPAQRGGPGRRLGHRVSAQRGNRLGNAERQPGRAQPAEQPVLGAGLVRRQVLADPQHPAATAVRHRKGLVVAAALGPGQFGVRRDAPAGEQPGRGFEARPGHHNPSLGG
jgi:hypothetical protein